MAARGGTSDALIGVALFTVFALPAALFLPSLYASIVDGVRTLLTSFVWLLLLGASIVLVVGVALTAEKAWRRWTGGKPTSAAKGEGEERFGVASPNDPEYVQRRARRVARESRMDEAAEKVIDKLEATGVGKLLKRKVRRSSSPREGKGKADEGVELSEIRRSAETTGVSRLPPPPLPPRRVE
ncbi:hypothetical protein JCM10213_003678 [Rhodosporidiobolus nylandii]